MTRYAVGDIQGCLQPLQCLLEQVQFNPAKDQLWCVGDLVNRGPDSLGTLRFLKSLGSAVRVVLGNHDLHFLAVAMGSTQQRRQDTFEPLLSADDRDELIHWLRQWPLLYSDPSGDYSMVHAGIPPQWSLQQASARADEIKTILLSDQLLDFLDNMYGDYPDRWQDDIDGWQRLRLITNYFTRMRFCTKKGRLDLENKSNQPSQKKFAPWFSYPKRKTRDDNIIFGHWASLNGQADTDNVFSLDTGCVWGGALTILNLETQAIFQCQCK